MAETVEERLSLLAESEQLGETAGRATRCVVAAVETRHGRPLAGEAALMFVTHVALALQRLTDGEPLEDGLPEELLAEVRGRAEEWRLAHELADLAGRELGLPVPQSEVGYLAAHLGALAIERERE